MRLDFGEWILMVAFGSAPVLRWLGVPFGVTGTGTRPLAPDQARLMVWTIAIIGVPATLLHMWLRFHFATLSIDPDTAWFLTGGGVAIVLGANNVRLAKQYKAAGHGNVPWWPKWSFLILGVWMILFTALFDLLTYFHIGKQR